MKKSIVTITMLIAFHFLSSLMYGNSVYTNNRLGAQNSIDIFPIEQKAVEVLPTPVAKAATYVTSHSFTANWDPVSNATHYKLYVKHLPSNNFIVDGEITNFTSYAVSGLSDGETFVYYLYASNSATNSGLSNVIQVTTKSLQVAEALSASNITQHEFTANWKKTKWATGYNLFIHGPSFDRLEELGATDSSFVVTGLESCKKHSYVIRAVYNDQSSKPSSEIVVFTKPEIPVALEATNVTQTSFEANWEKYNNNCDYYITVKNIKTFGIVPGFNNKKITGSTSVTVTGLTAGTEYAYKIQVVFYSNIYFNEFGTDFSNIISVCTDINYSLALSANPAAGGTVTGGGSYASGTSVTAVANANSGYEFVNWTENGSHVSSSTSYSFTIAANRTLVANFRQQTQNVSLALSANPAAGGTVSGGGSFAPGTSVTAVANANSGYEFVNWTENGSHVSSSASYSFTISDKRNLVANFNPIPVVGYTIAVTASPSNMGSVSGGGTYPNGMSVTVSATPASKMYHFVNWTEDKTIVSTDANYTFTPSNDRNLVANFVQNTATSYTIAVAASPSNMGSVSGGGTYTEGTNATVQATPNTGYDFVNWTENGTEVSTLASYTFAVTGDRTLLANFSKKTYTISTESLPKTGGSTNILSGDYLYNEYVTLIATPAEGYEFVNWTENGKIKVTTPTFIFNATASRHLVANFKLKTYTITSNPNNANAGETSFASKTFEFGQTASVSATAKTGYTFVNWTENNVIVSSETDYTFTVTANRNLIANFSNQSYTISTEALPAIGGTTNISTKNYFLGEQVTLIASPANGYNFLNWTENGVIKATTAEYSFIVSDNQHLAANFEIQTFVVKASSSDEGIGQVSFASKSFNYGDLAKVVATPRERCIFINWTEDGKEVSTEKEYSFTVTNNCSLIANFKLETSVDEISKNKYEVYPNPVSGLLNITGIQPESEITLVTLTGSKVKQIKAYKPIEIINTSDLKKGIYFLIIETRQNCTTQKVIVQ